MPTQRRPLALIAGVLALAVVVLGLGRADDDATAAVRHLLDTQVEDWNRKDLDAFLDGYWHAPGLVFQSGAERFNGFEAVPAPLSQDLPGRGREMGRLAFTELEVVVLGPDAALARGRFRLTMSDGTRPSGLFTLILRKQPEGWRIVHDHTSS